MKKLFISSLLVLLVLVGCGQASTSSDPDRTSFKVGITDGYQRLAWKHVAQEAEKEGITLEIVEFSDYTIPNNALNSGDIDLNSFQTIIYLDTESSDNNYDLTYIAKTIIEPMALYSNKINTLDELEDGGTVVLGDDVSNQGRALNLLAKAGLIELSTSETEIPSLKEITSNPKNLEFIETLPNSIPSFLSEVDLGVINGSVANDAGLSLSDALFKEAVDVESENPFINVIAVRTEDKDNPGILRLAELFRSDAVKEIIETETKGATVPLW
ncbi:hypothetical protein AOC36_00685 [Erysipelothrix larvae]|uniref:Lipoprotein n=1 Tax=Erysipelothrix larvae TaxID=1514105 RepID=A0A0X8GY35_9FIRM|nr:MetQ/NlpA family ABC transporter substrate-binding protein [Erysipelothrix larvae]AMC92560.1 hypothetical protein AOC36_00685 [Erysipelothrix larvae]